MALGSVTASPAATAAVLNQVCGGDVYVDCLEFNGDDAYPAGGTADFTQYVRGQLDGAKAAAAAAGTDIKLGSHGSRQVLGVVPLAADDGAGGLEAQWSLKYDKVNDTLVVMDGAAEATPGDLSGTRFHALVISC